MDSMTQFEKVYENCRTHMTDTIEDWERHSMLCVVLPDGQVISLIISGQHCYIMTCWKYRYPAR